MNVLLRILLTLALLFAVTLPLFKRQLSDIENTEDLVESYINDLTGGIYEYVKESADFLQESIQEHQKEVEEKAFDNLLLNGWGYGINTVGAVKMAYGNVRYSIYKPIPIIGLAILITTLLQIVFMPKLYRHGNGIFGLINILLVLALLGNTVRNDNYDGVLGGAVIFILIQSSYLTLFFIKKAKVKVQHREILE